VHISVFHAKHRRWQPGLKPHVAPPGSAVVTRRGVRTSAPVRMFIELASVLDLVDLVVAGDSMLRVLRMKRDDLVAELDRSRDYWSPAARAAARFVREQVDSPMESRLRMLIVLAGLPEPTINHKLFDQDGNLLVRFDLSYPALRLVIEYDGRQHVEVMENWEDDLERREFLDNMHWQVLKVTSRGLFIEPGRTIDRITRALLVRGVPLPPRLDDWRPFFPGRPTV
jgi:very-short-patch-repair endonuclease